MTEALPQTQTLSLRISETLRHRLEDIRKLTAIRKGESVSTSEIAKQLLEAAREDRLEVVELMARATDSLWEIRRKREAGQILSRAQWTVLAYYAQQGSEAFSENPLSRESYRGILAAFLAAYQLRGKPSDRDPYYLGNLPPECYPERKPSAAVTPEAVRQAAAETIRRVNQPGETWTPILAARNLYVLLEEEKLAGATALDKALVPYWPALWRVAARGHYFETRAPVRESGWRQEVPQPAIPSVTKSGFMLSFARGKGNEFSLMLGFPGPLGPGYPMGPYPMIAEFRAMLAALSPPGTGMVQSWKGEKFFGYVIEREKEPEFWFRANDNGITFGFSAQEWKTVVDLFRHAWEQPEVRYCWDALTQEYGEM